MSLDAMRIVWKSSLPPEWKYVLLALADQANQNGYCIYQDSANEDLQIKCSLSERTIRRRLSEMMSTGLLELHKPASQHNPPVYRIMLDAVRGWKSSGIHVTRQGGQSDPSEGRLRGASLTGQGGQSDRQGGQSDRQGGQSDRSYIRCLESPENHQESPNTNQRARAGEGLKEQGPKSNCLGDHEFELFWSNGPWSQIPGWEVHRPEAQVEFLRQPRLWREWQRAAMLYGMSADVQRFIAECGGRGVKYPKNFLRGSTWMGYLDPQAVETEEQSMARNAKDELTRALKRAEKGIVLGELTPPAKNLFLSLHTPWHILKRLALEGKDICGPQTEGIVDGKMLAAEGSGANAL